MAGTGFANPNHLILLLTRSCALPWAANGRDLVVALARAEGSVSAGCTTCDGGGTLDRGFRATVYGTTEGTGSPERLTVSRVESVSAGGCPDGNVEPTAVIFGGAGALVPYYNAHGSCMLLSWGLLLPSGVLMAKIGKHRNPFWFKFHRAVQLSGLTLAIIGCALAPRLEPARTPAKEHLV